MDNTNTNVPDRVAGTLNRRWFNLDLGDTLSNPRQGVGLVVAEIDSHRKRDDAQAVRDADYVLRIVGQSIANRAALGSSGPYRLDRDQFAVILKGVGSQEACEFAESVRADFERFCGDTALTISIGVAVASRYGHEDREEIINRANSAKIRAKEEGTNRVKLGGPEVSLGSYFEDLSPYVYGPDEGQRTVNIGWLDNHHAFPKGPVDEGVLNAILGLCEHSVKATRGFHRCPFCASPRDGPASATLDGRIVFLGSAEIRVRAKDKVFAAPTLVYHYIKDHQYRPPTEFLEAALAAAPPVHLSKIVK